MSFAIRVPANRASSTWPDGSTLKFTYKSLGSVTSTIDENGNKMQLVTDSASSG
jgi:YD repeat-containing protein